MFFMTVTILILFGSAFMTDVIGVHAIFGAFLAGIIVPREGNLTIALTEKLEDMVSIIFLPLYFTISGLSTDLGLLNNGITWAYVAAICSLAYSGKFGGCTIAARFAGFSWRESSTIGSLMSCKGLVELIVLNVGLSANILSPTVFSMFVLEALLLTFMTTPAVLLLYPPEKRVRVSPTGANFANVTDREKADSLATVPSLTGDGKTLELGHWKTRFTVVLDKIEHLPSMMALAQLMQPPPEQPVLDSSDDSLPHDEAKRPCGQQNIVLDALRLIELSDRTSAVMKSSVWETLVHTDPLLGIFRTFGELNGMAVSSSLSIVSYDDLASSVAEVADRHNSELVFVPWLTHMDQPVHDGTSSSANPDSHPESSTPNPFDILFRTGGSAANTHADHSALALHSQFVRGIFAHSTRDVALHVPGRADGTPRGRYHLFLPFFGGPDDRLALQFVVRCCLHPNVSATVVRFTRVDDLRRNSSVSTGIEKPELAYHGHERDNLEAQNALSVASGAFPDTIYGQYTTQTRLQSETADSFLWTQYAAPSSTQLADFDATTKAALSRIEWDEMSTAVPLRAVIEHTKTLEAATSERRSRLMAVVGRSRRLAVENHTMELKELMDMHGSVALEVRKTVGDVAAAFIATGGKASIVVLQAANATAV
ncbi:hypothetical protein EIP86_002492 [Pleurotus ostreatoroseus]|nr:hypothetical protein EIP86_002492 [Pleurotus ostreatoroseus]